MQKLHPNQPIGSKVIKGFLSTHITNLNVCPFGVVETMVLETMELTSSSASSPPHKILSKSTNQFKRY
jgi:hypothetical protein